MSVDPKKAIIDACLKEAVGGRRPPDMKYRILEALAEMPSADVEEGETATAPPVQPATKGDSAPLIRTGAKKPAATSRYQMRPWASVAGVLLLGTLLGVGLLFVQRSDPPVAKDSETQSGAEDVANTELAESTPEPKSEPEDRQPAGPAVAQKPPFEPGPIRPTTIGSDSKRAFADVAPIDDQEIVRRINELVRAQWKQYGVDPTEQAADEEWCRRTYVRLVGRVPNADELEQFVNSTSTDKRQQLVDRLVSSSSYENAYAASWADIWANVLIGRAGGRQPASLGRREGLIDFLAGALRRNVRYDDLAKQLVAAEGSTNPKSERYNPAVNFLLANSSNKHTLATSRVSRVFHGKQIGCVQCHDHPTNRDWKQRHFWEMNAFFHQMNVKREGSFAMLENQDFRPKKTEAEVFYQQRDAQLKVAFPVYPDGREAPRTGKVAEFDRRASLADALSRSADFSTSLVNRTWSHFFGHGFTKPVDDMGEHNVASHPELLNFVAGQFVAHGYDLRKLNRWMALSEPFALSSKIAGEPGADDPHSSGVALFTRYYAREMTPETVFRSLAAMARRTQDGQLPPTLSRKQWDKQFSRKMDADEGTESNAYNGDIRRTLEMFGGTLMQHAIEVKPGSVLHNVIHSKLKPDQKLDHLFRAAVSRAPTRKERELALAMIKNGVDEATVLQDIWWALLNSNEFILDH